MQNKAIEIHDSNLTNITIHDRDAVLRFSALYIHQSPGRPGIDAGSGWIQEGVLRIGNATVRGAFSDLSNDLSGGRISLSGTILENVIPIPLNHKGPVELYLESSGEVVLISGGSADLELIGEAKYVGRISIELPVRSPLALLSQAV